MTVQKYLARHAEPESALSVALGAQEWAHTLVLPARRESLASVLGVVDALAEQGLLCIVVVNGPPGGSDAAANAELLEALRAMPMVDRIDHLSLHRGPGADWLVVDRASPGLEIPVREGVGRARRIGSDIAVALWNRGRIASPWVHGSDADAQLPATHLVRVASAPETAMATVAPFRHEPCEGDDATNLATLRYELTLRYWVAGLRAARSPYAFHTIGSLISFRAPAYAACHGFPRRAGGEDFYLLNKLRKLGEVQSLDGDPVCIVSRRSDRVPFGTGPAVERLRDGGLLEVYDPRCFVELGSWLAALDRFVDAPSDLASLSEPLRGALEARGTLDAVSELRSRHRGERLRQQLRVHFDAFETLKLVHALTERWPKVPWAEALRDAGFLPSGLDALDVPEQLERLRHGA